MNRISVVAKFATTASDGKVYDVEYFNLDVIISVGYRVKSNEGTQFRIWATNIVKNHIINGFTINEKRLKDKNCIFIGKEFMADINMRTRVLDSLVIAIKNGFFLQVFEAE